MSLTFIFGNLADCGLDIPTCRVFYGDAEDPFSGGHIRVSDYLEVHG